MVLEFLNVYELQGEGQVAIGVEVVWRTGEDGNLSEINTVDLLGG
jgi:hypothetical protein